MSKIRYVGVYAASFALFIVLEIGLFIVLRSGVFRREEKILTLLLGVMILALLQFTLVSVIYTFLMLSKMWGAIQDGQTSVTVGKAIGYLFIPFFNLYWIFKAWGGFPAEYNRYIERYGLNVPKLGNAAFVAYPVSLLLGIIPLTIVVQSFVFVAVIVQTCDAVNALNRAVAERRNEANQFNQHRAVGF